MRVTVFRGSAMLVIGGDGVDVRCHSQLERTGLLRKLGDEHVFVGEAALGVSLAKAIAAAGA